MNKKGFMSISIIYSFLILFLLLMFSIVISYSNKLSQLQYISNEAKDGIMNLKNSSYYTSFIGRIIFDNNGGISDTEINFKYSSEGISKENTVTVNDDSQITNGLYYTNDSTVSIKGEGGKRIYYFRGNVDNNWVNFGGYKWRIVRTTSEGGVKIVFY